MTENTKNEFKLELPTEKAGGTYANLAIITHSSAEFVIDFASNLPGVKGAKIQERIILAPEHAKRLLGALAENVKRYEQTFGTIKLAGAPEKAPGATAMPFGLPKGEA